VSCIFEKHFQHSEKDSGGPPDIIIQLQRIIEIKEALSPAYKLYKCLEDLII
jgi:hypothetical protein